MTMPVFAIHWIVGGAWLRSAPTVRDEQQHRQESRGVNEEGEGDRHQPEVVAEQVDRGIEHAAGVRGR